MSSLVLMTLLRSKIKATYVFQWRAVDEDAAVALAAMHGYSARPYVRMRFAFAVRRS